MTGWLLLLLLSQDAGVPDRCASDADCAVFEQPRCYTTGCAPPCGGVYSGGNVALSKKDGPAWIERLRSAEGERCANLTCIKCAGEVPPPDRLLLGAACVGGRCTLGARPQPPTVSADENHPVTLSCTLSPGGKKGTLRLTNPGATEVRFLVGTGSPPARVDDKAPRVLVANFVCGFDYVHTCFHATVHTLAPRASVEVPLELGQADGKERACGYRTFAPRP